MAAEEAQRQQLAVAMKDILTPDQFTKWETDFKRMVEHMQRMRPWTPVAAALPEHGGLAAGSTHGPNDRRGGWQPGPPRDRMTAARTGDEAASGAR